MIYDPDRADVQMLAFSGLRDLSTTEDGQGVLLTIDLMPHLTELLGRLAIETEDHAAEFTDRLAELAWLHQRAVGLEDGSLDPIIEEVSQPTASDLRDTALNELLTVFGVDDMVTLRVPLRGMTAPTLARLLVKYTPEVILNAYGRLLDARSSHA